ncbi:exonuclease SbcCD subunit D [Leptolyngbya sp. 7M]|uniref:metallophosphoesterase family protein n=1 Tax=Leptolyngbya sp. 7M TaxID=2812896 RepID=UPI001B8D0D3B|nr:exonuclease SbcCD subunit D [Leptolyngbya sp. 7M]QYO66458.1 exonuclease SbcCD subunit D [Leptolyngbya sp. 7M]
MKFLHIADVHLGCTRYNLPESPRDFFDAWIDVLQKYAVGEAVDFVIMCGDFFHKRNVPPETMNYAVAGLQMLKDAGIPVVSIEGNHDQKYTDSDYSWLRSLANWNLVHLLEPTNIDGKLGYEPWSDDAKRGGFIDIGRARLFGSHWFGAAANWAIPLLTEAIRENRREGAFHLLMLHTDVEGHQTHPIPALSIQALSELKAVTDYVALGHTHMHYEIDNWAFNPGSIEVTNIAEFRETRGAFVVEIGEDNSVTAKHVTDYVYRPFQRLKFDVTPFSEPQEITESVLQMVSRDARTAVEGDPAPIIEITLTGQLGFPNSQLEMKKMRDETQKMTGALHVRVKNHSTPIEYAVAADEDENIGRDQLEKRVVEDLVIRDKRFRTNRQNISEAVIGAKQQALLGDEPEKIAEFISQKLLGSRRENA